MDELSKLLKCIRLWIAENPILSFLNNLFLSHRKNPEGVGEELLYLLNNVIRELVFFFMPVLPFLMGHYCLQGHQVVS